MAGKGLEIKNDIIVDDKVVPGGTTYGPHSFAFGTGTVAGYTDIDLYDTITNYANSSISGLNIMIPKYIKIDAQGD